MDLRGHLSNPDVQRVIARLNEVIERARLAGEPRAPAPVSRPYRVEQRLSPQTVERIVSAYRAGRSANRLGNDYSVSRAAIIRILRVRNVPLRYQPLLADRLIEATRLYESGLSVAAVAASLDISPSTLGNALRASGVAMRDRHWRPTVDLT